MAAADEAALLQHLHATGEIADSFTHAAALGVEHQALVGLLKSLAADGLVGLTPLSTTLLELTPEGEGVLAEGSPEWRLFEAVPPVGEGASGVTQEELVAKLGKEVVKVRGVCCIGVGWNWIGRGLWHWPLAANTMHALYTHSSPFDHPFIPPPQIGMGPLMKAKALKKDGALLVRAAAAFEDETRGLLERVKGGGGAADCVPEEVAKGLRKRQLVSQVGGSVDGSILVDCFRFRDCVVGFGRWIVDLRPSLSLHKTYDKKPR